MVCEGTNSLIAKLLQNPRLQKLCECVNLDYKNLTTLDYGKVYELAKVLTLDFGKMKINKIQQNKHNNWPQNLQMNMNIETQMRRQQTLNITIAKSTNVETYFLCQCYLIMCTSCWKQIHDPSCSKHCQALKFKLKALEIVLTLRRHLIRSWRNQTYVTICSTPWWGWWTVQNQHCKVVDTAHIFLVKTTISLGNKVVSMWMEEKLHQFPANPCKMLWNIWLLHLKPSMVQVVHGDRCCGYSCDLHPMMNEPIKKIYCIQFTGSFSRGAYGEIRTEKKRLIEALEKQDSLTKFWDLLSRKLVPKISVIFFGFKG